MMIFMLMLYMLLLILFLLFMFMYMYINNLSLYLEFIILEISSMKIEFLILLDWISLLFSSVVLFISLMVMLYSLEYMGSDLNLNRFMLLIIMFIIFMMLLIYMPNMISILVGWDGLGLVSYCLVIYYQNKSSYNSGMVTVLINRLGDIFILLSISMFIMFGSWNYMFLYEFNFFIYMMLMLASFTKSAQVPFSSWLPLAMAAPTPISSLVHSSTLVTAGVYLLIRLNYLLNNIMLINFMMLISIITMFLSGLGANWEFDLKKIIALSTLSQLAVMIFSLSMNLMQISLFHLLTHAMFKSVLFMCAGVIIHNMYNNQDIRFISMTMFNLPFISMIFNCSSLSLCGIPFLSGFFSKDLILEMFMMNKFNKFIFIMLFISMGLTIMYTLRLMYYSFIKFPQLYYYKMYYSLKSKMGVSMYLLFFMSIILGVILSWILFSMKNMIYLTNMMKMLIYLFMIMGMILGYFIILIYLPLNMILYCHNYIKYFMMLWFMPLLYNSITPKMLNFSNKMNYFDLLWLEYLNSYYIKLLIIKIYKMDYFYKNYMYIIILFMLILILLFF